MYLTRVYFTGLSRVCVRVCACVSRLLCMGMYQYEHEVCQSVCVCERGTGRRCAAVCPRACAWHTLLAAPHTVVACSGPDIPPWLLRGSPGPALRREAAWFLAGLISLLEGAAPPALPWLPLDPALLSSAQPCGPPLPQPHRTGAGRPLVQMQFLSQRKDSAQSHGKTVPMSFRVATTLSF